MTTSQPSPQPSLDPKPTSQRHPDVFDANSKILMPTARQLFLLSGDKLAGWGRQHRIGGLTRRTKEALFGKVVEPLMAEYAERYASAVTDRVERKAEQALLEATQVADRVKYFDESVCPTCKEPMHPKGKTCWKCSYDSMRKTCEKQLESAAKVRKYVRNQHALVQLAVSALGRSAKQKKKGPFVRQARAILEAALAEPEPGVPMTPWTMLGVGGALVAIGMMGYWATGRMGAWGNMSNVGPPPTAEELAASP